jgi:hypothetical protein
MSSRLVYSSSVVLPALQCWASGLVVHVVFEDQKPNMLLLKLKLLI